MTIGKFFIFISGFLKDFPRRPLENMPLGLKCVRERNRVEFRLLLPDGMVRWVSWAIPL